MNELIRFGVSIDKKLLNRFDTKIRLENYTTRSKAIADLITQSLIKKDLSNIKKKVAGTITMVFDHHKRKLLKTITEIQHSFHGIIISSQHIHLDHDNCLEIIVVKGKATELELLANKLKTVKGVNYAVLNIAISDK